MVLHAFMLVVFAGEGTWPIVRCAFPSPLFFLSSQGTHSPSASPMVPEHTDGDAYVTL